MKKRLICVFLCAVLMLPILACPVSAVSFPDVPAGAYYEEAVQWAVENMITFGTSNGNFSPKQPCTRAQVVTFLWRYGGCHLSQDGLMGNSPFTDVVFGDDKIHSYFQAILWAVEEGITTGKTEDTFVPFDTVTRGQVVTFLWRMAGQPEVQGQNPFRDVAKNAYYYQAVLWAVELGITTGKTKDTFLPNEPCTRSQVVTFLWRYENYKYELENPELIPPENLGQITIPAAPEGVQLKLHPMWVDAVEADPATLPPCDSAPETEVAGTILQTCDPDGYLFCVWDEDSFRFYLEDGSRVTDNLAVAIHEVYHGFSHTAPRNSQYHYLGHGYYVQVDYTKVVLTQNMVSLIPQELRTSRFDTYVAPGSTTSSNMLGIYGLLNEFNAYWTGMNHVVSMFDYYCAQTPTMSSWEDYFIYAENERQAYAEFRYYILTYLLYTKENEPEVYQGLMDNTALRYAFATIDANCAKAIETYEYQLSLLQQGHVPGLKVSVTDQVIWVGNNGLGSYVLDYNMLMEAMAAPEYAQMLELFCDLD